MFDLFSGDFPGYENVMHLMKINFIELHLFT